MTKIIGFALAATMALASTSALAKNGRASTYLNPDDALYAEEFSPVYAPSAPRVPMARMHVPAMTPFTWTEKRAFDRAVGDTN